MGLLLNSVRWDSVFVRSPGPKTHLRVLRPEKNRQFADGRGFNSRHLHHCEVSGHRSFDVPRLFVFWGVGVSGHRSLFVGGCAAQLPTTGEFFGVLPVGVVFHSDPWNLRTAVGLHGPCVLLLVCVVGLSRMVVSATVRGVFTFLGMIRV